MALHCRARHSRAPRAGGVVRRVRGCTWVGRVIYGAGSVDLLFLAMCGRYRLSKREAREFAATFELDAGDVTPEMLVERMNVKPTQLVPAVFWMEGDRTPAMVPWGVRLPNKLIVNARDDTVMESRLWFPMFDRFRVLIPATGFYEWSGPKSARVPHAFDFDEPVALGGIARWNQGDPQVVIVTTDANAQVDPVHKRMPVVIEQEDFTDWLGADSSTALDLMKPWGRSMRETVLPVGSV